MFGDSMDPGLRVLPPQLTFNNLNTFFVSFRSFRLRFGAISHQQLSESYYLLCASATHAPDNPANHPPMHIRPFRSKVRTVFLSSVCIFKCTGVQFLVLLVQTCFQAPFLFALPHCLLSVEPKERALHQAQCVINRRLPKIFEWAGKVLSCRSWLVGLWYHHTYKDFDCSLPKSSSALVASDDCLAFIASARYASVALGHILRLNATHIRIEQSIMLIRCWFTQSVPESETYRQQMQATLVVAFYSIVQFV